MTELSRKQLREVQLTGLEILQEVHRICEKHQIPYVIIAGTLLGSVRHGGFIPWDDDVDIALLRPDYERFREVCRKELDPARFVFQDDRCEPGYRWGFGKVRRKDTLFLREYTEHMPYFQGIFLDVFPMDEVPAGRLRRAGWNAACFVVRKFLWARVGKRAEGGPMRKGIYRLMDLVPERTVLSWYHGLIRCSVKLSSRAEHAGRERYVRILMYPTPTRDYAYKRSWYAERAPYSFEGGTFWGIRDAEEYLTFKFGNYRELPPENKRRWHPVSRLKLLSEEAGRDGLPENRMEE